MVFIVLRSAAANVLHAKVISGIEEAGARMYIIAVLQGDLDVERYADVVFWRPACPTLMSPLLTVLLQLFAMDMAKLKGWLTWMLLPQPRQVRDLSVYIGMH